METSSIPWYLQPPEKFKYYVLDLYKLFSSTDCSSTLSIWFWIGET